MIRPPKRSVTRFFIPLIDVLILLFCIFLLLPFAKRDDAKAGATKDSESNTEAELTHLEKGLNRLESERKRLEDVRSATGRDLSGRIAPILLRIDSKMGQLFRGSGDGAVLIDPDRNPGQVRRMVEADRSKLGTDGGIRREPYYLFLPESGSPFPTVAQRQCYIRWFAVVDAAADVGRPDFILGRSGP